MNLIPDSAEYALRALACMSALPPEERVRSKDLADQISAPPAFLSKVLRRLVEAELVDGVRGHHGGYRLARDPSDIRVIDVLVAMDALPSTQHCAFGWASCNEAAPCPLHPLFVDLRARMMSWATSTSLIDAGDCEAPPVSGR
jgi:Rrf2 family protein